MKKVFLLFFVLCATRAWAQPEIKPYGALPSPAQVKWQQLEYYMFIHFGPNTFTDKEWGHGDEDPKVFNPTELDARQWARTAKLAGMKAIIITAKHHDGFCLWPSAYSKHTVRESAWKNGKGDVLAELSAACKEYGLLFGVYLSPWDRNHPAYGTPEYNQVFAKQLEEVHTKYGYVFEQWFDGANGEGPNGKKQEYDWDLFHNTVRKYHPNVIFFSDNGPGCRWIGNENGFAGTTNWSTLNASQFRPGMPGINKPLNEGQEDGTDWVPGEADVSIRPGWFYSPSTDDKVKTLPWLLDIYYGSVGRNANLLLNVPVDRRGRIHKNDSLRLMELKRTLDADFKTNLAVRARTSAVNTRKNSTLTSAIYLTDNNYNTYWATGEGQLTGTINLSFEKPVTFNRLAIQEFIPLGQRVKGFTVSVLEGRVYREIARETTIGYKRILRLPNTTTKSVRIEILDAKASPVISEVKLFKAPEVLADPVIKRSKDGMVTISALSADPAIHYTIDGSEPTTASPRYTGTAFSFPKSGTIKAKSFIENGKKSGATVAVTFDLAPAGWKVMNAADADRAIDGDPATAWQGRAGSFPQEIQVDMGTAAPINGFTYTPRPRGGIIYNYAFYVSQDGQNWGQPVAQGSFANILNNPVKQTVKLSKSTQARYFKLVALAPADAKETRAGAAEIGVF
ncbi:alpha-L-fucosidase [Chitinophaga sp.]|uniref:alpha-L-fucosidase n=1 Tax=Chitinophaga sp. TaxID=1869181 RepID=UPI0031D972D0